MPRGDFGNPQHLKKHLEVDFDIQQQRKMFGAKLIDEGIVKMCIWFMGS
jgi:hypothetical protein